jgi:hypothetical protein
MTKTNIILDGKKYPVQNPTTLLLDDIVYGKQIIIRGLGKFKILNKFFVVNNSNSFEFVINTEKI